MARPAAAPFCSGRTRINLNLVSAFIWSIADRLPWARFSSSIAKFIFLGNGYIPTSSLREILAALDDQLTPDQLNEMIAEIDTDDSGTVDFDGKYLLSTVILYV